MELVGQADDALVDEARITVRTLRAQNQTLQQEVQQREAQIRVLTESLAIARTEVELFQKRWAEVQVQAQSLGVNLNEASTAAMQRHLVESIRQLHSMNSERQQLAEQLKVLVAAVDLGADRFTEELGSARRLLATTETQGLQPGSSGAAQGSVTAAKVLAVNAGLRLVVLNVGADQGARVGMPLVVMRGDRVVAELRLIEVRRNVCGALIEQIEKNVTLAAGDAVRVIKS